MANLIFALYKKDIKSISNWSVFFNIVKGSCQEVDENIKLVLIVLHKIFRSAEK